MFTSRERLYYFLEDIDEMTMSATRSQIRDNKAAIQNGDSQTTIRTGNFVLKANDVYGSNRSLSCDRL